MKKICRVLSVLLLSSVVLAGCTTDPKPAPSDTTVEESKQMVTVKFESNEGSKVADVKLEKGTKLTKPTDPTKADMTFGGWYSDIDLTQKFDYNKVVEADITLYAKWDVTLAFDSKGGSKVDSIVGKPASPFTIPDAPVREGYTFVGWFSDEACTKALTIILPAKNATAYAKWQVRDERTKLTLANSYTVGDPAAYEIKENEDHSVTFIATKAKPEWSFAATPITYPTTMYKTVVANIKGTKDAEILLKVEGGGVAAYEERVKMTGENQEVELVLPENALSQAGGQKFLFFLLPGVAGCNETTPEMVTINSVTMYRTVDEGQDNQEYAVYFDAMGGSDSNVVLLKKGEKINAPKTNPTRANYLFGGWYDNKECSGEAYKFGSNMGEANVILYAKWNKVLNMLDKEFVSNDQDVYTITKAEDTGAITFVRADDKNWSFAKTTMMGDEILGYHKLILDVKGEAGERVLFKVNDNSTAEKWVDLTGELQHVEIEINFNAAAAKPALLIFVNPEAAKAKAITISNMMFTDYVKPEVVEEKTINFMDSTFTENDKDTYDIQKTDGKFIVKKIAGHEWVTCKSSILGKDIHGTNVLKAEIKGPKGLVVLLKVNDQKECRIVCTGEKQYIEYEYSLDRYFDEQAGIILFVGAGTAGASEAVEITKLELSNFHSVKNALDTEFSELDANTYEYSLVNGVLKFKKTSSGEWIILKPALTGKALKGFDKVRLTVQGVNGQKLLFKVNDQPQGEKMIECDGTVQTIEIDYSMLTIDESKAAFILFAGPGVAAPSEEFVITSLEFVKTK